LKISACIIARNEEQTIGACLASILPVVDEIIVVDTGSTDNTPQIAKFYNAKVFNIRWQGFSHARNFALEKASHNWILRIDADEVLSPQLINSILQLKSTEKNNENKYYVARMVVWYSGKKVIFTSWMRDRIILLYNRDVVGGWHGSIHEHLQGIEKCQPAKLNGVIHHFAYDTPHHHKRKILFYARKEALAKYSKKTNPLYLLFSPLWKFIKDYIIYLGFMGGKLHFIIAWNNTLERIIRNYLIARLNSQRTVSCLLGKLLKTRI